MENGTVVKMHKIGDKLHDFKNYRPTHSYSKSSAVFSFRPTDFIDKWPEKKRLYASTPP